ncbi:MAG TPA: hypothetical protein VGK23_09535 [Methanomassiliicoccales archaeon]|jgi:hypothetical protein
MGSQDKPAYLGKDLISFKKEVSGEIESEKRMLHRLKTPVPGDKYGHLISIGLVILMAAIIFQQTSVFILWLIIAILLYSYNYLIFFIPTTMESIRPDEKDVAPALIKERRWFALRLLLKKRKLAIEIGLTLLLGGAVPLSLSFSIIFGLAFLFSVYFGFFTHIFAQNTIYLIMIQITLIILFYVMMLIIKPQAQGITKIGRSFRLKLTMARSKGKAAYIVVILTLVGMISIAGVLVFGAMVLPGFLLPFLYDDLRLFPNITLPIVILVFVIQLVIMRHFQGIISRRMAVKRLENRILELDREVLSKPNEMASEGEGAIEDAMLDELKSKYYSIAIYDLIEQDIFGYSKIYLFGLRLRYMLDEDVIAHINVTPEKKGSSPYEKSDE